MLLSRPEHDFARPAGEELGDIRFLPRARDHDAFAPVVATGGAPEALKAGHWVVLCFRTVYASAAPGTADYKPNATCSVPNTPSNINDSGNAQQG